MKRFITVIILAALMVCAASCAGYATSSGGFHYKQVKAKKGYVTKFYDGKKLAGKIKTSRRVKVYVVDSEDVYPQFLWERKNNFICVEVIRGECINDAGDGVTSDGYYISYKRVAGHKAGARYTTYCVYANNNYEDDIRIRVDYLEV